MARMHGEVATWRLPGSGAAGAATADIEGRVVARSGSAWGLGRRCLQGPIVRVGSTREGRLALVVRTKDGEIELHGTSRTQVFDAQKALPLGDLWNYVGSEAVITWRWQDQSRAAESVAIR